MSEAALSVALHRLGYKGKQSLHGFRASARTILDEVLQQRVEHVEHRYKTPYEVGAVYWKMIQGMNRVT